MSSVNDKNNIAAAPDSQVSEIITPLDVHTAHKTESRLMRRWAIPAAMILGLLSIVSAGGWFLHYLSNRPFDAGQPSKNKAALSESSTPEAGLLGKDKLVPPFVPTGGTTATPTNPKPINERQDQPDRKKAVALMATGREHESRNDLRLAQDAYQKAFELDPDNKESGIALNRVAAKITDQQYRLAMSEGLEAYAKADYARSKKNLLKANALKPSAREAQQALARVDRALLDLRIDALNQNGQAAERVGNWQDAGEHYANALKLDRDNEFAKQGKERALTHNRIFEQIQSFLNRPETLTTSKDLEKAETLVREAQNLEPKGIDFTRSLEQLERMVVAARKPVRLTITSDNQTQVDVYRIGRLGRFSQKELDLKPGVYTVVGYRDGYQDVRQQVVIDPGQENLRVTIICKVKV